MLSPSSDTFIWLLRSFYTECFLSYLASDISWIDEADLEDFKY